MKMRDSEIMHLLASADAQVHIDKEKKQKAYYAILIEMEKQEADRQKVERTEAKSQRIEQYKMEELTAWKREGLVIFVKDILFQQFRYMDKMFFYIYGGLICLGIIIMAALQYMEVSQNEIVTVCMVGAGILSTISISLIDKVFFGEMAELGATCYLNTKQCVAAWMVLTGMMNVVVLFFAAGYLNVCWRVGLLQVGLYILTPYLLSGMMALGILSMEAGRKHSFLFSISGIFLSIGYGIIGTIPEVMNLAAMWIWAVACIASAILFMIQVKTVFNRMEKGDILCMS